MKPDGVAAPSIIMYPGRTKTSRGRIVERYGKYRHRIGYAGEFSLEASSQPPIHRRSSATFAPGTKGDGPLPTRGPIGRELKQIAAVKAFVYIPATGKWTNQQC
jgi:hypothetical protein